VLVELDTGRVTYFEGRMRVGYVYGDHLRSLTGSVIAPWPAAA
jgi:hypothetical protein